MRREDRAVRDMLEIEGIISRCRVCRLAFNTGGAPYIVPMNFGCRFADGALTLYFHCALEGRKLDLLAANPLVGFEMDSELGLVEGANACKYGFAYESVIGTGRARLVTDAAQKCAALSRIMLHQTGRGFSFSAEQAERVAIIVVNADAYTVKRRAQS